MAASMCRRRGLEVLHQEDADCEVGARPHHWLTIPALVRHSAASGKRDSKTDGIRFTDLVDWDMCSGTSSYAQ